MKLADLKKLLGMQANEEDVKMEFKDSKELTEFVSAYESKEKELSDAFGKIASLEDQLKEFAEAKALAEAQAAQIAAKAKQEKVDARMAALSKEFGDEKAAKFSKFAETMENEEFAEIFGVQQELSAIEEQSFNESGIDAQVKEDRKMTHFKQFIKKEGK
jgi:hypothetical protein